VAKVIRGEEIPFFEAPGELRRFGKFMISPQDVPDASLCVGLFVYPSGARSHAHRHPLATEVYYCLTGELEAIIEGKSHRLGTGDLVIISPGEEHYATNPGQAEMRFVAIHTPPVSDYDEFKLAWQKRKADLADASPAEAMQKGD
jgi:quercetin dioxygenase-like cupin family protein